MTACPACSGISDNVLACGDMCANVMKGCLAQYAALDTDWNQFVGEQFLPLSLAVARVSAIIFRENTDHIDAHNLLLKVFGSYAKFFTEMIAFRSNCHRYERIFLLKNISKTKTIIILTYSKYFIKVTKIEEMFLISYISYENFFSTKNDLEF